MSARLPRLGLLLGILLVAPSCVSKPSLEEVRDRGLHTPVQTLQSFSVALRANWPQEEYTCFSSDFKARNGLSRLGYLEFRDRLMKEQPLLRYGLTKATCDPSRYDVEIDATGRRARILVEVSGRQLVVLLRRESFYEVFGAPSDPLASPELWKDDLVEDLVAAQMLYEDDAREQLAAIMPHPGRNLRDLAYLRMGREWKIDDLYIAEEPSPKP